MMRVRLLVTVSLVLAALWLALAPAFAQGPPPPPPMPGGPGAPPPMGAPPGAPGAPGAEMGMAPSAPVLLGPGIAYDVDGRLWHQRLYEFQLKWAIIDGNLGDFLANEALWHRTLEMNKWNWKPLWRQPSMGNAETSRWWRDYVGQR